MAFDCQEKKLLLTYLLTKPNHHLRVLCSKIFFEFSTISFINLVKSDGTELLLILVYLCHGISCLQVCLVWPGKDGLIVFH